MVVNNYLVIKISKYHFMVLSNLPNDLENKVMMYLIVILDMSTLTLF